MQEERMYVAGRIVLPIYFSVRAADKLQALRYVKETLNSKSISVIQGDIHTWDGKEFPLITRRCSIEWYETVRKEEIF